jgi:hypothetical protein
LTIPDTLLDRFFDALVKEIRGSRPGYLRASFTVAEIYQNLVPYRTHRDAIGAEINGDYEDALLRLLAGEGEFLQLESEPARKRIQDELRSSNPNTTIYREFAAAEVRLHPGRARMLAAETAEGTSVEGGSGDSAWRDDPAGRPLGGGRVEVGWAPEEATPVVDPGPSDSGVNPDLGLFVSDLFGGGGGEPEKEIMAAPEPVEAESTLADAGAEAPPPPPPSHPSGVSGSGWDSGGPASLASPPPAVVRQEAPSTAAPLPPPSRDLRGESGALSELEDENRRLRRIVADQALEILRLKDLLDRS